MAVSAGSPEPWELRILARLPSQSIYGPSPTQGATFRPGTFDRDFQEIADRLYAATGPIEEAPPKINRGDNASLYVVEFHPMEAVLRADSRPREERVEARYTTDPRVIAEVFELARRELVKLGYADNPGFCERWRKYPPTPLTKPLDAPIDNAPPAMPTLPGAAVS